MNLSLLCEPFAPNEIEWRIGQAGTNDRGVWAKVLAYVTNRAIMQRLDDVCGAGNWKNEFRAGFSDGAVLCGISIKIGDEWVTKWDGAENTDVEAVKGGLSNSMKRAAVQWGIGRYLYDLEEGWAKIGPDGEHYVPKNDKKGTPAFRWSPPALPAWARPKPEGGETAPAPKAAAPKPKRDILAGGVEKAKLVEVRGRTLEHHTTNELAAMEAKLKAEGGSKHRDLLGSITLVLSDRPQDEVGVARMNAAVEADERKLDLVGVPR